MTSVTIDSFLSSAVKGKLTLLLYDLKIPPKVLFLSLIQSLSESTSITFCALHDLNIDEHCFLRKSYPRESIKQVSQLTPNDLQTFVSDSNANLLILCDPLTILPDDDFKSIMEIFDNSNSNSLVLVNKDTLPRRSLDSLEYHADQFIDLKCPSFGNWQDIEMRVTKVNKTGAEFFKVVIEQRRLVMNIRKISNEDSHKANTDETGSENSMDKLTTFNLKLTENEENLRAANVKLPYVKIHQKVTSNDNGSGDNTISKSGATIFYEPDKEDDFDYEDPDDDLDI